MQKGNIGVTTENIFPVIKKFLYSDHEIFLREIISNAVDATQKMKTLQSQGEFTDDLGDLTIRVSLDAKKKTLTVSDRGIGMTAEEIDKYINQIAFSGATDFLEKFKDNANAIIGHFGLGFYSAFMVSKKVEIISLSYKAGSKAVKWTCDGTPEYKMEECKKADRGTDIVMHIDDECKEYLEKYKIEQLLKKYCRFLPVSIAFGKKTEWKDGKEVETDEDNIINDTDPIWRRKPADLKDEDYQKFYRALYPGYEEPLFWIHLNVDYPFNLTGVLFFPKIKNDLDLRRNKIQLYCNQVFVTDSVENIVPDFLTLLHGVIDSPDIPLNVSRSYLQSDANVKKISKYITKKVSDRLESIFKEDRKAYEQKWDDLKLFIHYGLLSEPDFWEKGSKVTLLKDTDGKYFTLDEYKTLIRDNQTDKNKTLVYLYATDATQQYTYIQNAKEKGYSVLLMDGQLDIPLVGMLESKLGDGDKERVRFSRVDSDTVSRLIPKEEDAQEVLDADESANLSSSFKSQIPKIDKAEFMVEVQPLGADEAPAVITQSEYMRRMKEMSKLQSGMSFYGEMPDMYTLILNSDHPAVSKLNAELKTQTAEAIKPIEAELKGLRARQAALRDEQSKEGDKLPEQQKKDLEQTNADIKAQEDKKETVLADFAKGQDKVRHLIDLALLQNGMLRGEALNNFVRRSVQML
ncbi:MAG: molecular chaperone HtpG [Bacteroidaceae bacterium]|nr:molecular chaperone HtpG [Bacteroidaceae bacterium]